MNKIVTENSGKEKITALLQTFSPQEVQRFKLFLQSPFYNQNLILNNLFEIFQLIVFKPEAENYTQQTIWKQLFGTKKFNNIRYQGLLSDLNKLAELFVTLQTFTHDKHLKHVVQLQTFNQRGLDKQYLYTKKQTPKIADKKDKKTQQLYLHQYLIETEENEYLVRQQNRSGDLNIEKQLAALDNFYLLHKLQGWCAILHYKSVNSVVVPVKFDIQLLEYLKKSHQVNDDLIQAYYFILLSLMHSNDESNFKKQKQFLQSQHQNYSAEVLRNLYLYAINYCIQKIVSGKTNYYDEIFDLYKTYLTDIFIDKKQILSPWDYKNITTVAIRLKEFNWAENFITSYQIYLPKPHRHNAITYNLAKIYFEKKEFEKCLKQLLQVDYNDVFYLLDTKITQIKTLYELKELDTLDSLVKSFRLLIKRKKIITQQHQKVYFNFIKFVALLMRNNSEQTLTKARNELSNLKEIVDAKWLMEKLIEKVDS